MRADEFWKAGRAALVAGLACFGGSSCAMDVEPLAEPEEVEVSAQAILGGQDYVSCTPRERGLLRSAAFLGRAIASSHAYEECLELMMEDGDIVFGPYTPYPGDRSASNMAGHIANVLAVSRTTNPAEITCKDVPAPFAGHATGQGWMHTSPDRMDVDEAYLAQSPDSTNLAALIWHEHMHTHGYGHVGGDIPDDMFIKTPGVTDTVPYIVYWCFHRVMAKTDQACGDDLAACGKGARMPVASSYEGATSCTCIHDPGITYASGTGPLDKPAPSIGTPELNDHHGQALALGDFNGDGARDLAVGTPGENGSGGVHIYIGTHFGRFYPERTMSQSPLASNTDGDEFGSSLAAADWDDDGFDDLAVGAPGKFSSQGRVLLYRGSANGLQPFAVLGQSGLGIDEDGDRFGHALVSRWDGDEWNLVVSAPKEKIGSNPSASGYVFVFDGGGTVGGSSTQLLIPMVGLDQSGLDSNENGDNFGWSLAAGDIDTDDPQDIAVGAPGEDAGVGTAYSFATRSGSPSSFLTKFRLLAPSGAFQAGTSVAIGNFLNTTFGAVAVGIPYWDFATARGGVAVYDAHPIFPEPPLAQRKRFEWQSTTNNAGAGFALATMPPRQSDAFDRLAVGAPGNSGFVQILRGRSASSMYVESQVTQQGLSNNEAGDSFGYSLVANVDTLGPESGLIVGAPGEATGSGPAGSGAAYHFQLTRDAAGVAAFQYHIQGE